MQYATCDRCSMRVGEKIHDMHLCIICREEYERIRDQFILGTRITLGCHRCEIFKKHPPVQERYLML